MSEIWNQLKCLITNQDLNTIKHFPQPPTTTQQIDCLSILNYPFIPTSLLNYWNRKTYLEKKSLLLQISLILSISLYILTLHYHLTNKTHVFQTSRQTYHWFYQFTK